MSPRRTTCLLTWPSATFGFDCPDEGQAATICQPRRRSWVCGRGRRRGARRHARHRGAADLTQNAVNDVVDTLADTTVFPTVFTDRTRAAQFKQFTAAYGPKAQASTSRCMNE